MRVLWEIFTLLIVIAALFAIGRGFPQFGNVLKFLVLNPIGLLCTAGLVVWIVLMRKRAAERKTRRDTN